MKPKNISEAKDPDLRASFLALQRASALARKTAIQTGTRLVIVRDGRLERIPADELGKETSATENPAS